MKTVQHDEYGGFNALWKFNRWIARLKEAVDYNIDRECWNRGDGERKSLENGRDTTFFGLRR